MVKTPKSDRPPSERDIYCDVLAYLADKPSRTCYDASNPAFIHSIGPDQAHRMMEETYGKDVVGFTRGFIGPVIEKFVELHPTPSVLPPPFTPDDEALDASDEPESPTAELDAAASIVKDILKAQGSDD